MEKNTLMIPHSPGQHPRIKKILTLSPDDIKPDATAVLATQGMPATSAIPPRILELYNKAERIFMDLVLPKAIIEELPTATFADVYAGAGLNEQDTPLAHIFPQAQHLALFACTMGPEISAEIEELQKSKNLALGYMLDAIASFSADKASHVLEKFFLDALTTTNIEGNSPGSGLRVLAYSPGYCGWHISGQEKLFSTLNPGQIGMRLNKSFLMSPLKSISGALVAGHRDIHFFVNNYRFCNQCQNKNCRQRILSLKT